MNTSFHRLMKKFINRETIVYIIAGVMTTAVNILVYYILCSYTVLNHLIANIIAWVVAVTFAYFINAGWVFRDINSSLKAEAVKMSKFFLARVFSLLVEEGGLFLLVNILQWNNMVVKAGLAVIVIVLNYLCSKFYVFTHNKSGFKSG